MELVKKYVPSVHARLTAKTLAVLRILHAKTGYTQMQLIEWAVVEFEKNLKIKEAP